MTRPDTLRILQQADALLEGWTCESSTDCCRFSVTGREPYVTRAEWELVVQEVKRQGRKLPRLPDDADAGDGKCAFLDEAKGAHGRCTVYAARPLGCRTFFCERARDEHGEAARVPREAIQQIARDLSDHSGDKARPLRSWLAEAAASPARRARR